VKKRMLIRWFPGLLGLMGVLFAPVAGAALKVGEIKNTDDMLSHLECNRQEAREVPQSISDSQIRDQSSPTVGRTVAQRVE